MVDVKRRKGESFESLLRRFSRRVQQSGKMLEARKFRFHVEEPNKNAKRSSALRRMEIREKRDYLMKVGKLVEEPRRNARGRR
jgi:ribosomal protein S21